MDSEGTRCFRRTGRLKLRMGQPTSARLPAQAAVGVHGVWVADRLQHGEVRDGVAVRVRARQVVTLGLGQLGYGFGLGGAVRVVLHLAREAAVLDHHPGGHDPVGAEQRSDGLDDLRSGSADDHDVAARRVVLLDEGGGLVVDDGVDQGVQSFSHYLPHLLYVPTVTERGKILPHPLHLVMVDASDKEDELCICGA